MAGERNTEPRIFVEVRRVKDGLEVASRYEMILLTEWVRSKFSGYLAAIAINTALAGIGWKPQ
jgi:hypothetical protein